MRKDVISAKDEKCYFCKGIVYIIRTKDKKKIIEQCSSCGALRILKEVE